MPLPLEVVVPVPLSPPPGNDPLRAVVSDHLAVPLPSRESGQVTIQKRIADRGADCGLECRHIVRPLAQPDPRQLTVPLKHIAALGPIKNPRGGRKVAAPADTKGHAKRHKRMGSSNSSRSPALTELNSRMTTLPEAAGSDVATAEPAPVEAGLCGRNGAKGSSPMELAPKCAPWSDESVPKVAAFAFRVKCAEPAAPANSNGAAKLPLRISIVRLVAKVSTKDDSAWSIWTRSSVSRIASPVCPLSCSLSAEFFTVVSTRAPYLFPSAACADAAACELSSRPSGVLRALAFPPTANHLGTKRSMSAEREAHR